MAKPPSDTPLKRRAVLAGGAAAVPLSLGLAGAPAQAGPVTRPQSVLVEPRRCRQVIRGFGGMTHASWIGELTPSQCDTVFDNGTDDLGFTILRIPVPEDRANWSVDLATAQAAAAKGALVFASPWNPPEALAEMFERVDEAPSGSQYEAETAALVNAHIATDTPGYQGSGYAHFDGASDASVEFTTVYIGSLGTKNLAFRYSAPADVRVDVHVGGALAAAGVLFPRTEAGEWKWKSIQAAMTPGQWPVKVIATGEGGPDLDYLMAAPYTPPAEARRLRHDAYGAYADHLNDFVHHMSDNGVDLYGISVQNEPDYAHDWTWWTTEEMNRFLRDFAGRIDCRVIAPESFQYVKSVSDPILEDDAALANVDILGAHLYGTAVEDFPYPLFEEEGEGKELWMTEVYHPNSSSSANLWPEALKVAEHVHHAMVDAGFQAYVWWYLRRFYGPLLEDGTISKRGRMLAHYAKFVRPGHVRVEAHKEPQPGVLTSAYTGDDGAVTVVAVNTTAAEASQAFTVKGRRVRRVRPWLTDATRDMEEQPRISGRGDTFTASLPPESVTTFVVSA
ncbi:glycoside hydrolase family 30 beta sandwich domain-containing protein [Glycomyces tritici]|uniref:Glycoside hydrolase family 30 beta sandwich domain-containing protein n=1 Tax=Glycomyces tritici TaxID=2665176 RepID=A0ABT7YTX0_9ACTN|nr:glycoside hydrolase family 30 beta sandwich domain-containing protein [Glycomyces tritici]MDN3242092.1 glycoside hydrolase family 30 beta sandwich domain-containing protein [Glycomyces tritici]